MATENPGTTKEQAAKGEAAQAGSKEQQQAQQPSESRERRTGAERSSGGLSRREPYARFGPLMGASPFALMRRMMEDMDRMFEELGSSRGGGQLGQLGRAPSLGFWEPQVDVVERGGKLFVRADLPGLRKDDVRVEVTDEGLVLEGERRSELEEEREGMFRSERSYGSFRRIIPLPEGVEAESAEARFDNGVLEVTFRLPQEQARRRRIEIQEGKAPKTMH